MGLHGQIVHDFYSTRVDKDRCFQGHRVINDHLGIESIELSLFLSNHVIRWLSSHLSKSMSKLASADYTMIIINRSQSSN